MNDVDNNDFMSITIILLMSVISFYLSYFIIDTILHELGHLILGSIFGWKIYSFSIFGTAIERNLTGGIDPAVAYDSFYNSSGHRAAWNASYATSIYSVGFRRMNYDESTGTWVGGGSATVQYLGYDA